MGRKDLFFLATTQGLVVMISVFQFTERFILVQKKIGFTTKFSGSFRKGFVNLSGFEDWWGGGGSRDGKVLREQLASMFAVPFAQAASMGACPSSKWSRHAHTCSLLVQVGMSMQIAQCSLMGPIPEIGDPCF